MTGEGGRPARSLAIILIVHLAVIILWQILVDAFQVPKFILPSPLATLQTLASAKYAWPSNVLVTAVEILGGFGPLDEGREPVLVGRVAADPQQIAR